jgi:hypothetical protein
MGRSVSTHRHAVSTFYTPFDAEDSWEWDDFIEDIRYLLKEQFKSLHNCDRWVDREDRVILENRRGEISISQYCGLVAICIAPLDSDDPLDCNWAWQASKGFQKVLNKHFEGFRKIGSFSNGEGVYERI